MAKLSNTNQTPWRLWLVNCWLAAILIFFIFSRAANSGFLHRCDRTPGLSSTPATR